MNYSKKKALNRYNISILFLMKVLFIYFKRYGYRRSYFT